MSWLNAIGSAFSWLGGQSLAASLVRTAVGIGLMRYLNKSTQQAPQNQISTTPRGVRQQIQPATDNKLPVVYGDAYLGGTIFDVRLTNSNREFYAAIAICERTGDVFSSNTLFPDQRTMSDIVIDDIYINNSRVIFKSDGTTVSHLVDDAGNIDTNPDGILGIYLYKGSSNNPMLPTQSGTFTPIAGTVPPIAYTFMPNWTSSHTAQNIVFAIVKLNFNPDKNLTSLPNFKFHVKNTLTKPGDVFHDYATNLIYGAGVDESAIDNNSVIALNSYSDDLVTYAPYPAQKRYTINGVVRTSEDVLSNMQRILASAGSYISYDNAEGKISVVINKPSTKVNDFDDSNILGQIAVTGTALDEYYNSVEVQFPYAVLKDQPNFVRIDLPSNLRNANEPDNQLQIQHELVNNVVQASILGNLELRQSREDLAITFETDYSKYDTQIGDIVGVTNSVYGWSGKLFKVLRVKRNDNEDGSITLEINAISYNDDVFTVEPISEFTPAIGGINAVQNLGAIPKPESPMVKYSTLDSQPSIFINSIIPSDCVVSEMEVWYSTTDNLQLKTLLGSTRPENGGVFASAYDITSAIAYSNTLQLYLAASVQGKIVKSVNGAVWTYETVSENKINKIIWATDKFVAVGDSGTVLTSIDGNNWVSQTSNTTNNLNDIVTSDTVFVAVGDVGTIITSPDAVTWTVRSSGTTNKLNAVIWNSGSTYVTKFNAIGNSGTIVSAGATAVTWTNQSTSITDDLLCGGWVNGRTVVAGKSGSLYYSTNALPSWTLISSAGSRITSKDFISFATTGSLSLLLTSDGDLYKSTNGVTWEFSSTVERLRSTSVTYVNSQFLITLASGTIFSSTAGAVWNKLVNRYTSLKTTLLKSGSYVFSVRAVNQAGSSVFSDYSSTLDFVYTQAPDVLPYNVPTVSSTGETLDDDNGNALNLGMLALYVASKLNWGGILSESAEWIKEVFGLDDDAFDAIQDLVSSETPLVIKDEGNVVTSDVKSINFVGAGVTTTVDNNNVTVTIPNLEIRDENTVVKTGVSYINFTGTAVQCAAGPNDSVTVDISGTGGGTIGIRDEGNVITGAASIINFRGPNVTASQSGQITNIDVTCCSNAQPGPVVTGNWVCNIYSHTAQANLKAGVVQVPATENICNTISVVVHPTTGAVIQLPQLYLDVSGGPVLQYPSNPTLYTAALGSNTKALIIPAGPAFIGNWSKIKIPTTDYSRVDKFNIIDDLSGAPNAMPFGGKLLEVTGNSPADLVVNVNFVLQNLGQFFDIRPITGGNTFSVHVLVGTAPVTNAVVDLGGGSSAPSYMVRRLGFVEGIPTSSVSTSKLMSWTVP